ncbi:MAG TPA: RagB/SusD family nutrient uptake outer membrane protein [Chitinophagaceae bacterium]|nr:RagB/SusD family nutrient uptake outer membrane protein [Chitinophagaceae bacterium]
MKKFNHIYKYLIIVCLFSACKIDRFPESEFSDADFWNTEADLINAANRMYQQLDANWIDNRGDDAVNQGGPNTISNGTRTIPNTSGDWNDRYDEIFTANNILEKAGKAQVTDAVRNRYYGEARFFRAYAYLSLLQKYGDVPLVLKTLDINSPELYMGRTRRSEVIAQIYADLDFAAEWLPSRAALPAAEYGRVTKSAAWALKARAALYEGTRAKFHNTGGWQTHLQVAVDAAQKVMTGQGHNLYSSYQNLFLHAGEGPGNTENIFVKIYGVSNTNLILGHNNSRDLENGRMAPTRNLIRQYLYSDGLPAFNTDNTPAATRSPLFVEEGSEASYNTILDNRDPRLALTVYRAGEEAYKGPWVPTTSLGARSAFAAKKGFSTTDQTINGAATVDRILIRYAEVLLIYAEAKFELTESISDADLNLTINALRTRVGFAPKLTNAFVTANNLSMREEIRRERTVELALEGFRYDDLIRWKKAEVALPQELLGAKFIEADWPGTNPNTLNLNADRVLIVEPSTTRMFQANRDYLYPVPFNEITLSGGSVVQNPNWQ